MVVGFKNRYMVMEVFLDPNNKGLAGYGDDPIIITRDNVQQAIIDSIKLNFGECGLASSLGSFQVKYINYLTKLCIIRASRDDYQKVWSAITMVRSIGNCSVMFCVLDFSGSIKGCRNIALKYEETKVEQYKLCVGAKLTSDNIRYIQERLERIKILEH